jgi:hypothetical protein
MFFCVLPNDFRNIIRPITTQYLGSNAASASEVRNYAMFVFVTIKLNSCGGYVSEDGILIHLA